MMCDTAIIDATTTTVVSLQTFLGSGLPLSEDWNGISAGWAAGAAPNLRRAHQLKQTLSAAESLSAPRTMAEMCLQILNDIEQTNEELVAAQADPINIARGVLSHSLDILLHYRQIAQDVSLGSARRRTPSEQFQKAVCGTVLRGALWVLASIAAATGGDAAKLRAAVLILTEVSASFARDDEGTGSTGGAAQRRSIV